jgi:hypothetical protein
MRFTISQCEDINSRKFEEQKYKLVYLMVGEDPYNALKGKIPVKVGESKRLNKRRKQVKDGLKPKDVYIDGVKQTIHITNPQLLCVTVPLAYAEAVEKAAQKHLCKRELEKSGASAKISGYNDWFQVDDLQDAVFSLMLGIEEVEGDISLENAENYHLTISRTYYNHEFSNEMQIIANKLPLLFGAVSDTCETSLSDKQTLSKSKKKYILREVRETDHIPPGENPEDWLTLVVPIRNCVDKKCTMRMRIPIKKEDIANENWDFDNLSILQIMSMVAISWHNKYFAGIGGIRPDRRALLLGEPRYGRVSRDGSFEWKNSIEASPEEWWRFVQVR